MTSLSRKLLLPLLLGLIVWAFYEPDDAGSAMALDSKPGAKRTAEFQANLIEKWGIEIVGIRLTARGHMVDFRYRVVDAAKAASLLARNKKPFLVDQESGKVLAVPRTAKVGPLRTSNAPKEGKVYWMFFGNPGLVKTGSTVSVVIGDFKVENLIVQ
jgi:hypothetical protein